MSTELSTKDNRRLETVSEHPTVRPPVDIYENRDEYLVVADLPGVDKDRLDIQLVDSQLTIEGQVGEEAGEHTIEREFRLINYRRSFELPEHVDRQKVAAKLENGVLTLHLPKSEAVKPKRIQVQAG